jgi:hypothetical protein
MRRIASEVDYSTSTLSTMYGRWWTWSWMPAAIHFVTAAAQDAL